MKALRNLVDNVKPTFTEGGKFGFLASFFDAFETFLFVPNTTTKKGAHVRDCIDMKRTMFFVVLALIPAFRPLPRSQSRSPIMTAFSAVMP